VDFVIVISLKINFIMMKQIFRYGVILLVPVAFFFLTFSGRNEKQKALIPSQQDSGNIVVRNIPLPVQLTFAGEDVPLQHFDVREALDKELHINVYWHSSTIFLIKRAARFFPVIEPILAANNVPSDFKYLAVAESGLQNIVSPSEAAGVWQLLKPVAREYGLEINEWVDERYNLEKATEAACKYLKKAYEQFGSWTLAAASYNMGMNGMKRIVENQQQNNYYNLYFNDETARYIYRILAIKIILENPEKYGFHIEQKDLYAPLEYTLISVDSSIENLASFAASMGTNYKMLKLFNPWLRNFSLMNKHGKIYYIKIPREGYRETVYQP